MKGTDPAMVGDAAAPPVMPAAVAEVFGAFPEPVRLRFLDVRRLLFETATTEGVGPLTETLRWGEPAYLSQGGSTVRLGLHRASGTAAVLFQCRTTLIANFRERFAERLRFDGNRAILLEPEAALPEPELAACLLQAFTYHARRRAPARPASS